MSTIIHLTTKFNMLRYPEIHLRTFESENKNTLAYKSKMHVCGGEHIMFCYSVLKVNVLFIYFFSHLFMIKFMM